MEWVYHVYIIKVCGCSLVGKVYGMFKGQIPYGKGFKFCVTGLYAPFIVMIELGKAGRHFSASGPRGCYYNEGTGCFYIVVFSVSFVTVYKGNICRIAFYIVMEISFYIVLVQSSLKNISGGLTVVLGNYHGAYIEVSLGKLRHKADNIHVIGYPQIPPYFVLFDVFGTDYDNDFCLI